MTVSALRLLLAFQQNTNILPTGNYRFKVNHRGVNRVHKYCQSLTFKSRSDVKRQPIKPEDTHSLVGDSFGSAHEGIQVCFQLFWHYFFKRLRVSLLHPAPVLLLLRPIPIVLPL